MTKQKQYFVQAKTRDTNENGEPVKGEEVFYHRLDDGRVMPEGVPVKVSWGELAYVIAHIHSIEHTLVCNDGDYISGVAIVVGEYKEDENNA